MTGMPVTRWTGGPIACAPLVLERPVEWLSLELFALKLRTGTSYAAAPLDRRCRSRDSGGREGTSANAIEIRDGPQ